MSLQYEDNIGLIHLLSKRVYGRISSLNLHIDYEDLFQDLSIVFLKAVASFDETKGFKFSTYFSKAAYSHADSLIKKSRIQIYTNSIEELPDYVEIESQDSTQEESIVAEQELKRVYESLSGPGKIVVKFAMERPNHIESEMQMIKDKTGRKVSRLRAAFLLYEKLAKMTHMDKRNLWSELSPLVEVFG